MGDTEHKYIWQGSKLVSEYYDGTELEFFYDESGNPYAFSYKADTADSPVFYYYLTNLQGDVTAILDTNGNIVAGYTYDAWGKLLSATGDLADINPLRYRGYYYDAELEMYYLKSRYYDPEICRFINADVYASIGDSFLGLNMFAYCFNCPVSLADFNGGTPGSIVSNIFSSGGPFLNFARNLSLRFGTVIETAKNSIEQFSENIESTDNILEYKEHSKKGTTNPSNRNKHQQGQTRKQRDQGGEKGDLRRRGNPNKRHVELRPFAGVINRAVGGVIAIGSAFGILYLIVNDATVIGVADDAGLIPAIEAFRRGIIMVFA